MGAGDALELEEVSKYNYIIQLTLTLTLFVPHTMRRFVVYRAYCEIPTVLTIPTTQYIYAHTILDGQRRAFISCAGRICVTIRL